MSYFFISAALFFVFTYLPSARNTSGDAIYRGELDYREALILRIFAYMVICGAILWNAALIGTGYPFAELSLMLIGAMIEASEFIKQKMQTHAAKRSACAEDAHSGAIVILTPSELEECEKQRLADIVHAGQLDDILALCAQNIEFGMKSKTFHIPRWLTRDQYNALKSAMKQKDWHVDYTDFCQYTNRPKLRITRLRSRRATERSDR